ncbi:hypothetical protein N7532_004942 [Penicillium argentinense]|uniref:ASST-domain-containing protein n=1 Tax=Penicillium argentinense TaxID=1131581 RepID=A0A9W9FCY8_9EURO|nr:uncharacterized protein N7532_004942 [Penicillium argentinense]KAJ5097941.1 hypothetical protein N7532_004942 [Penicillium argentinense]
MFFWLLLFLSVVSGILAHSDHEGFMSFVTLPDVWAPRYNVQHHDRDRVSPGYWFVAPYGRQIPKNKTTGLQPFHVGPHIYDKDGTLIWTGSDLFGNLNAYDFRVNHQDGENPYLSWIVEKSEDAPRGRAVILNQSYELQSELIAPEELEEFDIHEFRILPGGKTALACAHWPKELSLADLGRPSEKSFFAAAGFYEFDLTTGEKLTWWDSSAPGNIALHESVKLDADSAPEESPGHDYVHINSVDKDSSGDYLVSMRFTNTIYLVSGTDGTIKWRLGGRVSDFEQDFTFSKQHDARFLESSGDSYIISFLNNASDDKENAEDASSALIVELTAGSSPKTARVIHRYNRPDSRLSRLRGNAQQLPNKNMFVSWSDNGYISEFSPEGDNLMEAKFLTTGFYNYRAYKFEFVGRPSEPPAIVASVGAVGKNDLATTIHVSWNGATDIDSWNFYAQDGENNPPYLIGSTKKTNFETVHTVRGHFDWISVEPLDRDGIALGKSQISRSTSHLDSDSGPNRAQSENSPGAGGPKLVSGMSDTFKAFSSFVLVLGSLSVILVGLRWLTPRVWPRIYECIYHTRRR